jgi:hypothetical protein
VKIRPVGAELFHAHRQTDKTELIVALRNFVTSPKSEKNHSVGGDGKFKGEYSV